VVTVKEILLKYQI